MMPPILPIRRGDLAGRLCRDGDEDADREHGVLVEGLVRPAGELDYGAEVPARGRHVGDELVAEQDVRLGNGADHVVEVVEFDLEGELAQNEADLLVAVKGSSDTLIGQGGFQGVAQGAEGELAAFPLAGVGEGVRPALLGHPGSEELPESLGPASNSSSTR